MTEERFTEIDHAPLAADDPLARAIHRLPEASPARDPWPAIAARLDRTRALHRVSITWGQMAAAAVLLVAVSSGFTWLATRPSGRAVDEGRVVVADAESGGAPEEGIKPANFADAQYESAVSDLERLLRVDRGRLDPRTIVVIERNLRTIDQAIAEARRALDRDPANPYLNSHLADARRRKLDLLRRATELTSMGGD